jgi:hypothetical protein
MNHMHPVRQRRLSRGWEPTQLVGRMKILAHGEGIPLPKTYLLLRAVFLWENHRAPLPGRYARLIDRALTSPSRPRAAGCDVAGGPTGAC